ncbi:ComEC/Rec2 family competence protein [Vibrio sinaloensis]|nr:ComEC/Rec2 family competence protein [Vibrio sinaloensis]
MADIAFFQRVGTQTQHLAHQGLIKALLFGVRDSIPESVQSGLQRNGLNHLVAISGLHVGIMYAVGWFVGGLLLRLDGRFHFAPMLCGVAIASFYAYLAGFFCSNSSCTVNVFIGEYFYCLAM